MVCMDQEVLGENADRALGGGSGGARKGAAIWHTLHYVHQGLPLAIERAGVGEAIAAVAQAGAEQFRVAGYKPT